MIQPCKASVLAIVIVHALMGCHSNQIMYMYMCRVHAGIGDSIIAIYPSLHSPAFFSPCTTCMVPVHSVYGCHGTCTNVNYTVSCSEWEYMYVYNCCVTIPCCEV